MHTAFDVPAHCSTQPFVEDKDTFASHWSFRRAIHLYQHVMTFLSGGGQSLTGPPYILIIFGFAFPQVIVYFVIPCTCISMQCIIEYSYLSFFVMFRLAQLSLHHDQFCSTEEMSDVPACL